MTLENLKKNYERLKWLASGEFTERDFDYKIDATDNPLGKEKGEGGWSTMGDYVNKTGQKRKELIMFKAKKAIEEFENKYDENYMPKKKEQPKPVTIESISIPLKKPKSKEKK